MTEEQLSNGKRIHFNIHELNQDIRRIEKAIEVDGDFIDFNITLTYGIILFPVKKSVKVEILKLVLAEYKTELADLQAQFEAL